MTALIFALALLAAVAPSLEPRRERVVVVRGTVRSESGLTLQGANVYSTSPPASVGTDHEGHYLMRLSVAADAHFTIRVRSVGFRPQERELVASTDTLTVDFVMQHDVHRHTQIVTGIVEGTERARIPFTVSRIGETPIGFGRIQPGAAAKPGRGPHNSMVVVLGSVRNERGDPLQWANVFSNELRTSTRTDSAGCYSLNLSVAIGSSFTIRVRSVGFKPAARELVASADTMIAHFTLHPYTNEDTAIVVGDIIVGNERRKVPFEVVRITDSLSPAVNSTAPALRSSSTLCSSLAEGSGAAADG